MARLRSQWVLGWALASLTGCASLDRPAVEGVALPGLPAASARSAGRGISDPYLAGRAGGATGALGHYFPGLSRAGGATLARSHALPAPGPFRSNLTGLAHRPAGRGTLPRSATAAARGPALAAARPDESSIPTLPVAVHLHTYSDASTGNLRAGTAPDALAQHAARASAGRDDNAQSTLAQRGPDAGGEPDLRPAPEPDLARAAQTENLLESRLAAALGQIGPRDDRARRARADADTVAAVRPAPVWEDSGAVPPPPEIPFPDTDPDPVAVDPAATVPPPENPAQGEPAPVAGPTFPDGPGAATPDSAPAGPATPSALDDPSLAGRPRLPNPDTSAASPPATVESSPVRLDSATPTRLFPPSYYADQNHAGGHALPRPSGPAVAGNPPRERFSARLARRLQGLNPLRLIRDEEILTIPVRVPEGAEMRPSSPGRVAGPPAAPGDGAVTRTNGLDTPTQGSATAPTSAPPHWHPCGCRP